MPQGILKPPNGQTTKQIFLKTKNVKMKKTNLNKKVWVGEANENGKLVTVNAFGTITEIDENDRPVSIQVNGKTYQAKNVLWIIARSIKQVIEFFKNILKVNVGNVKTMQEKIEELEATIKLLNEQLNN